MTGPEKELAETAKKVAKEKFNLDVELVAFNDYVVPNEALNQGDIDVNVFQHQPYLQEQSKQRGFTKLTIVGNTFVFPIVAYSKRSKPSPNFSPVRLSLSQMTQQTAGVRYYFFSVRESLV
nr:MetQ/NlpA family ABC transporter substrate-binding protein [Sphingobacterium sp. E70]